MARPIRGIRFGSLWSFPDTSRSSFSFPSSFEDRLGRLSIAIGVAGAGVAVALQDVLASIAGAFSIGFSRLYGAGDRVQIGDTRGDVIDIGLLRTTLIEVGNWVSSDLYSWPDRSPPQQHGLERIRFQLLARIPVYLGRD